MSDLEFTGERLIPDKSPPALEAEHRARYEFAKGTVAGKRVIDLGCGEGYGSHMLSEVAASVVGVDISSESIEHAKPTYKATNLSFEVGDVTKLPFQANEFDACVCLEVIEHVENPDDLLREVARILKPDGVFIASTPNGAVKVSSQPNPFHKKEYSLSQFAGLLRGHFPSDAWDTVIHGQFARGKRYSALRVVFKNTRLTIKGMLGFGKAAVAPSPGSSAGGSAEKSDGFDFRTDRPQLAEYLIAVVKGRRR